MESNSNTHIAVRDEWYGGITTSDEVDLTVLALTFDASDDAALLAILSKHIALFRDMATACVGVLSQAPDTDLWDATSAHDLR